MVDDEIKDDPFLPTPSKYCFGCGRWLTGFEKYYFAKISWTRTTGERTGSARVICEECKMDGVSFD